MSVNVLLKKELRSSPCDFVRLKQYMIIEDEGKKYLVVRLVNDRAEEVTGASVNVVQLDAKRKHISRQTVSFDVSAGPGKNFVPKVTIPLADETVDCEVSVASAESGDYSYTLSGDKVIVEYGGRRMREMEFPPPAGKRIKPGVAVTRRTMKAPLLVIIGMLVALEAAIIAMGLYLKHFLDTEKTFLYSGVEYAFVNDDRSDGSDIIVVGSNKSKARVVIPESIEGHTVIGISDKAFANDDAITSISFEADIPVGERAFVNCRHLRSVDFAHITEYGEGAFMNCRSLERIEILPEFEAIPSFAFYNCKGVKTLIVREAESSIGIGDRAFAKCNIDSVVFERAIDYTYRRGDIGFFAEASIGSLKLLDFDEERRIADLFAGVPGTSALGELTITSLSHVPALFCSGMESMTSFAVVNITEPRVGDGAFSDCAKLGSFSVGKLVTSVGRQAFYNTALTSFDGSKLESVGERAFAGCSKLATFKLVGNTALTAPGDYAFEECSALNGITVPVGVTVLPNGIFSECKSLSKVAFATGADIAAVGERAFYNCSALETIEIPSTSFSAVGERAFAGCESLSAFAFPTEDTVYIGAYAFADCSSLTEFAVPQSVAVMEIGVFEGCSSLEALSVPFVGRSVDSFSYFSYMFGGSNKFDGGQKVPQSLASVQITAAESIDNNAFFGCEHIREIIIPEGLTVIGDSAFCGCSELASVRASVAAAAEGGVYDVVIPNGVAYIGYGAFAGCNSITSMSLPFVGETRSYLSRANFSYIFGDYSAYKNNSVPEGLERVCITDANAIGENAFYACEHIKEISINQTVTTVGSGAFADCSALRSLVIPSGVTTIGSMAFSGCSSLAELSVPFIGGLPATYSDYNSYNSEKTSNFVFGDEVPRSLKKLTLTSTRYISTATFSNMKYLEQLVLDCPLAAVADNAFWECYKLFEIYNGSSLSIAAGSGDHGRIAERALVVHSDMNEEPLPQVTQGDFRFVRAPAGTWHMIDYTGTGESVYLPNGLTSEQDGAVSYYAVWGYIMAWDDNVRSVSVPRAVTSIGEYAFFECRKLASVDFDSASPLLSIKPFTFCGCRMLDIDRVPAGVTEIGEYAFYGCTRIKMFIVEPAITSIEQEAFGDCNRLFEVYDFSPFLNIAVGSPNNGSIAKNARAVYTADTEGLDKAVINNVEYIKLGDGGIDWWAVDYYGTGSLEIKPFTVNGSTVNTIGIYDSAFLEYDEIKSVVLSDAVTSVGTAFAGCENLKSVTIQKIVGGRTITIDPNAFYTCFSLETFVCEPDVSVVGENALYTHSLKRVDFRGDVGELATSSVYTSSLTSFTVAGRMGEIDADAFIGSNSDGLSVTLGSAHVIHSSAFRSTLLKDFKAGDVDIISDRAFVGSNLISAQFGNVGMVGQYAFSGCYTMTSVAFDSVGTVEMGAFENCRQLASATLGLVGSIGDSAFINCGSLTTLGVTGGISSIGASAFAGSGLTSVNITGDIGSIGSGAFASSSSLRTATFGNISEIGPNAFARTNLLTSFTAGKVNTVGENAFYMDTVLNSVTLRSVEYINKNAFNNCTMLNTVAIPGVKSIGESAFINCTELSAIDLGSELKTIAANAFYSCWSLEELVLPDSVTTVAAGAFENCRGLRKVTLGSGLNSLPDRVFNGDQYILSVYNRSSISESRIRVLVDSPIAISSSEQGARLVTYSATLPNGVLDFAGVNNVWCLYSVTNYYQLGTPLELPESFTADGQSVNSYYIRKNAITSYSFRAVMGSQVSHIYTGAIMSGAVVFYKGDAAAWAGITSGESVPVTALFYSDCIHPGDEGMWRYDNDRTPTTANTVFGLSDATITKPATCTQTGVKTTVCPHCKRQFTDVIDYLPHSFEDGKCTVCHTELHSITEQSFGSSLVVNDSIYPFGITEDNTIYSVNNNDNTTSTFTVIADRPMTVYISYRASSESPHDYGQINVGSSEYLRFSGTQQGELAVALHAGERLTIKYIKDGSASRFDDCVYFTVSYAYRGE